ncbi:metallophosphoesterase [Agrobacterium rosae]|uniref:Metallophosphoesterase n=1 Tax=Agrobacterium rosae TaxID=1972867 RepID=A0ABU4W2H5_9HYPH|nr:metallophosphoesterase [Agrobacterium rosae]MDX8331956.1 metallophosphoesterase [Agrobacterium rosae]
MPESTSTDLPKTNIIAVGDIHGMSNVLNLLFGHLEKNFSSDNTQFVFLGDLVDRGPESAPTMDLVAKILDLYPRSKLILGNHDHYLREFLRGGIVYEEEVEWLQMGGIQTLRSYNVDQASFGWGDLFLAGKSVSAAYPHHLELLEKAVPSFETLNHFFTHAGVDPEVPLADQWVYNLMWIREEFLDYTGHFEKTIVHGHTITKSELPEVRANRISLDSGSFATRRVSAAIFSDDVLNGFVVAEINECAQVIRLFDAEMQATPILWT